MLQVYSGAYYAAKGDTQAQQGLMALGQQIETALPALSVLGQFPLAASAIVSPPNVLIPASATTCGDLAYNGSLDLSLEGIAGGTFTGQLILYRTETASGCATFASAVSGTLVISSSLVPAASSSVPSTSAAAS